MAYGYNDGDQRRQSVRLAGRTTPTPRRATSSNPQRPQEQPRPSSRQQTSSTRQSGRPSTGTSAQQESRLSARSTASGRGSATAPQRPPPARHLRSPLFFAPTERTQRLELSLGISSRLQCPRAAFPPCTHRTLLYRRVPDLFIVRLVYLPRLGRPRSNRRGQAAQGPGCARLLVCVFDPAFAVASRHHAPYLSD